jgi:Family of unknown function (DUF5973)
VSTAVLDAPITSDVDLDELQYLSVVDEEFRAEILAAPDEFGLTAESLELPAPVEGQDRGLLDFSSGGFFASNCISTCSFGPITWLCDGTTK